MSLNVQTEYSDRFPTARRLALRPLSQAIKTKANDWVPESMKPPLYILHIQKITTWYMHYNLW